MDKCPVNMWICEIDWRYWWSRYLIMPWKECFYQLYNELLWEMSVKCYLLVHYFVICGEWVNSDNVFWCCISFSGYIKVSKTSVHTQKQTICYTEYILLCKIHCSNTRRREAQRDGRNRKLWTPNRDGNEEASSQTGKCLTERQYLQGKHSPVVYDKDASRTTAKRTKIPHTKFEGME